MEKRRFHVPPTLIDLNEFAVKENCALLEGNVDLFEMWRKQLQDKKRPFSTEFTSMEQLVSYCAKNSFKGVHPTPEANGIHLWNHENAHKMEADRLGIASSIRIAELDEPHHSKFSAYLDIDMDSFMTVTERIPSKVLFFMGRVDLAPSLIGLGYERETNQAQMFLKRSKILRFKEFIRFK